MSRPAAVYSEERQGPAAEGAEATTARGALAGLSDKAAAAASSVAGGIKQAGEAVGWKAPQGESEGPTAASLAGIGGRQL